MTLTLVRSSWKVNTSPLHLEMVYLLQTRIKSYRHYPGAAHGRRRNCNHKIRCIFNSRLGTVVFVSFVSEPLEICSPRSQWCPEVASSKRAGNKVLSSSQRWEITFFRIEKRWWTVQWTNPIKTLLWNGDKHGASNWQKETNGWWKIDWCSAVIWCWAETGNVSKTLPREKHEKFVLIF